ncbi:MAG: hypothetical protein E7168_05170 [Firmicutes bacterium]|nr:hypothetical protein [Bacillota bacterium]
MKNIFKYFIFVFLGLFFVGCGNMMNTPTKKVEEFLSKYQRMDKAVLNQLDEVIATAGTMTSEQKEKYRELMKKQYKNLSYKIKDDIEDGNGATVEVEIEVYDYATAISESESYMLLHKDEFINSESNEIDDEKFMGYKLDKMNETKEKIKYTINFTLTKEDSKWELDDITDIDIQKLHGLYS